MGGVLPRPVSSHWSCRPRPAVRGDIRCGSPARTRDGHQERAGSVNLGVCCHPTLCRGQPQRKPGDAREELLRPRAELQFEQVTVKRAQNRMQRRRAGGVVEKPKGPGSPRAIIAPPFGESALGPIVTQHRTTGQGENGWQGIAFPAAAAKIWYCSKHLDERLRLCYHTGRPSKRVLAHAERAGQARLRVGQNALPSWRRLCNPFPKTE